MRLSEDFHLDSLGRVQLAAALEERLTDAPREGVVDAAKTLGDLRQIAGGDSTSYLAKQNQSEGHKKQKEEFDTADRNAEAMASPTQRAGLVPSDEARGSATPTTDSQQQAKPAGVPLRAERPSQLQQDCLPPVLRHATAAASSSQTHPARQSAATGGATSGQSRLAALRRVASSSERVLRGAIGEEQVA